MISTERKGDRCVVTTLLSDQETEKGIAEEPELKPKGKGRCAKCQREWKHYLR